MCGIMSDFKSQLLSSHYLKFYNLFKSPSLPLPSSLLLEFSTQEPLYSSSTTPSAFCSILIYRSRRLLNWSDWYPAAALPFKIPPGRKPRQQTQQRKTIGNTIPPTAMPAIVSPIVFRLMLMSKK